MKTKNLKYNITISTAPAMPKLGKGTECVQLLLSQVSKDMHEPLVPMLFPILGAQVSESKFQDPDLSWKELCGMTANLVADSGVIRDNCPTSWKLSVTTSVNMMRRNLISSWNGKDR